MKQSTINNFKVFENKDVVNVYSGNLSLQKPEETILSIIQPLLSSSSLLDVGVGMGRTTFHLKDIVKKYKAVDISTAMIDGCKNTFPEIQDAFQVENVTDMSFEDGEFDIVLFSYNGIDNLDLALREKALIELKRVLRPGGLFIYSTHNIRGLKIDVYYSLNPIKMLGNAYESIDRLIFHIKNNPSKKSCIKQGYGLISEKTHGGIVQYYGTSEREVDILRENGFDKIRIFSLIDGIEMDLDTAAQSKDCWLYYLCTKQ